MNMFDRLDQLVHRLIEENDRMRDESGRPVAGGNESSRGAYQKQDSGWYSERGGVQQDLPIDGGAAEDGKTQIKERILKLISHIDDVLDRGKITNE